MGEYYLGGLDMEQAYGYIVSSGVSDFLKLRKPKKRASKNWPEQNGTEWDLLSPLKYEDRLIVLKGCLVAASEADFWAKFNALIAALNFVGTKPLLCVKANTTRQVFFEDSPGLKLLTPIVYADVVGMELDLTFQEVTLPVIPGLIVYFGYSLSVPGTAVAVKALPFSQSATLNSVTLNTGTNRFFNVFVPDNKIFQSAYDQTSQEDVTSEYLAGMVAMAVDGIAGKTYTMQMAVAYSANHSHFITLTNA